jgi:hypothetical protein
MLITAEQHRKLIDNGRKSAETGDDDHFPVVRLMTSHGWSWIITEADPDNINRLFGLIDLGMNTPEVGHCELSQIENTKLPLGMRVERDTSFTGHKPLSVYMREADEEAVRKFAETCRGAGR